MVDRAGVGLAGHVAAGRADPQVVAERRRRVGDRHGGAELVARRGVGRAEHGAARGRAPVEPNSRYASPVPPRPGAPASMSVHGRPSTSMPDASAAPKRSPAAGAPAPGTLASVTARGARRPSRTTIAPAACARSARRRSRSAGRRRTPRPNRRARRRCRRAGRRGGRSRGGQQAEHDQECGEKANRHAPMLGSKDSARRREAFARRGLAARTTVEDPRDPRPRVCRELGGPQGREALADQAALRCGAGAHGRDAQAHARRAARDRRDQRPRRAAHRRALERPAQRAQLRDLARPRR